MPNCKSCNTVLDALHMGDIDPELCIICERRILQPMIAEAETDNTTLVLWG